MTSNFDNAFQRTDPYRYQNLDFSKEIFNRFQCLLNISFALIMYRINNKLKLLHM